MRGTRLVWIVVPVIALGAACGNDEETRRGNISGVCDVAGKLSAAAVGEISAWLNGRGELAAELAAVIASALTSTTCSDTLTHMRDFPNDPIELRLFTDTGPTNLDLTGSQLTSTQPSEACPPGWDYDLGDVVWCENGKWGMDLGS